MYKKRFDGVSNIIQTNGGEGNLKDIRYVFVKESLDRIIKKPILGYGACSIS